MDPDDEETSIATRPSAAMVTNAGAEALAATMRAMVGAKFTLAQMAPRSLTAFRESLLKECRRPAFADRAIYRIKRGGETIEGLTIRFAEGARRAYRNLDVQVIPVVDDDERCILFVQTLDLEANVSDAGTTVVRKTVERRYADGRDVLGHRKNSDGKDVYIVRATADEVQERINAAVSKLKRNQILALIPRHLRDEAEAECRKTQTDEIRRTLDSSRMRAKDAFEKLGIAEDELTRYLGKPVADASADDIALLRQLKAAIDERATTWADALASAESARRDAAAPPPVAGEAPGKGAAATREAVERAAEVARRAAAKLGPEGK